MSKNTILWIVIGVLVIAGIAFAVTRKSGSDTENGSQSQATQDTASATNATPENQAVQNSAVPNCTKIGRASCRERVSSPV